MPGFALVPVRTRHDGWTAEKQQAFIAHLAEGACVVEACKAVNMSEGSAYKLRNRPDAEAFDAAWHEALQIKLDRVTASAFNRAVNGDIRLKWHKGEIVGEERVFSDRLQFWMMRHGADVLERASERRGSHEGVGAIAKIEDDVGDPSYRVWRNDDGDWITNAPSPPDEAEDDLGGVRPDHPEFWRYLTDEEEAAWESRPERLARAEKCEAARRALFGLDD